MSVNDTSKIVIDDSKARLQIFGPHTDDSRGIIYYCCMVIVIDIEGAKIDCSSLFIVPATSAAQNRLLFLLWLFTVLMKKTHAVKQSIIFRCLWLLRK